jgi:hypothetical protein
VGTFTVIVFKDPRDSTLFVFEKKAAEKWAAKKRKW